MSDEPNDKLEKFGAVSGMSRLSVLQAFDRIVASLPPRDPLRPELLALREGVADQEEMIGDARQMIEKLEEVIKKVTSPANRIGTYLGSPARDTAHIVVGGCGLLLQRRSADRIARAAERHARARERSLCHRRRSRL